MQTKHATNGWPAETGQVTDNINNQPAPTTLTSSGYLEDGEREILERAGFSSEEINRADAALGSGVKSNRSARNSLNLAATFAAEIPAVLEQLKPRSLITANVFGSMLQERGTYRDVRGFNAVGDHLGKRGLKLPAIVVNGKRHYDISYVGADEATKAARQQELGSMRREVLALLIVQPLTEKEG